MAVPVLVYRYVIHRLSTLYPPLNPGIESLENLENIENPEKKSR